MAKERYAEVISDFNKAFGFDFGASFAKSSYEKLLQDINIRDLL